MRAQEFAPTSADQVWNYVKQIHPADQQGSGFLERLIRQYPEYQLQSVPLSSLVIHDQESDDPDYEPPEDPYGRVQDVDPEYAGEISVHNVDRKPIVIDREGFIIDGNHRAWAAAELLGRDTIQAWVPVKSVTEEAFNGIDISLEIQKDDEYVDDEDYDNQVIYVTASSNGRELGHVLFAFDGEYLMPQDLEVDERYRGQGIAATMYNYVKSRGYRIRRSGQQTAAGTGFWAKHNPGQNVWEQQELTEIGNTRIDYQPNRKRKNSLFHTTVDRHWVDVFFDRSFTGTLQITFTVDQNYKSSIQLPQGTVFRIFSTVLQIIKEQLPEYMRKARPPKVSFTAEGGSRVSLYRRMFVPVVTDILGPRWRLTEYPGNQHLFIWEPVKKNETNPTQPMDNK
jgi:GNAT superfamily N-acetyltransferase